MNASTKKLLVKALRRPIYLHLLTIAIIATIHFMLYMKLWLSPGFISYGDTNYMFFSRSYLMRPENLLNTYNQNSISPRQGLWYRLLFAFFIHLLGGELGHKTFLYVLLLLAAFSVYYGFYRLYGIYFSLPRAWILALISMTVSFYNFYNGLLQGIGSTYGVSTIFVPYALYFLLTRQLERKDFIVLFLLIMFCSAQPIPVAYSGILLVIVLLYYLLNRELVNGIKRISLYIVLLALASMYYLLPTYVIYYILHLYATGIPYTKEIVSYRALKFLSLYKLIDLLFTGQHAHMFLQYHPDTRFPQNSLLLIVATLPLLFIKGWKNIRPLIISLYALLVITVFLSKGVNPPFGLTYYYLVQILPSPVAAFLRNPTKFAMLYMYALALLAGLSINYLHAYLATRKAKSKVAILGVATLTIITIGVGFSTLLVKLDYFTYANFGPHSIPRPYVKLYKYLSNSNSQEFTRVATYPIGGAYIWTRGDVFPTSNAIFTDFPCTLLPTECYPLNKFLKQISILNFRYVILHNDTYHLVKMKKYQLEYNELLNTMKKYSINRNIWCSLINETYYRIIFKYTVRSPKPLDSFRVEISLTSSNLRSDVLKYRVSELFTSKIHKSLVKEGNEFLAKGFAVIYLPQTLLKTYAKAYSKTLYIYVDPYSGGFTGIIPNPLRLGVYANGKLVLKDKHYYLNNESDLEAYIKITNVSIKNESIKWCIELYELNVTPVNIFANGKLKPLVNSTVIKSVGDVYKIRASIPYDILESANGNLVMTMPFTFDKANMWSISVKVNGKPVELKVINVSNVIAIEIPVKYLKEPSGIFIEVDVISKVYMSFLVGLTVTLLALTCTALASIKDKS